MLKYSLFHTWVLQEERTLNFRVGISKHILTTLGKVNYIELPKVGGYIEKGSSLVILETSKSAVEVYSPITGKVLQINTVLENSTESFNQDPEGLGWLCLISTTEQNIIEANLLSSKEYHEL